MESSIISVKEARKILGKEAKDLNDTQIRDIIITLSLIAREYLKITGSK
jgi:hypothetical protein